MNTNTYAYINGHLQAVTFLRAVAGSTQLLLYKGADNKIYTFSRDGNRVVDTDEELASTNCLTTADGKTRLDFANLRRDV